MTAHASTDAHQLACAEKARCENKLTKSVGAQLCGQFGKNQQLRRNGLVAHLSTLKTLLRQGVSIRGTDDESNIMQFNLDKSAHEPGLIVLMADKRFMSHSVLQEQNQLLVLETRKNLVTDIQEKEFYSIIADEACDITKAENLSISIGTCDEDYAITEDFLGIYMNVAMEYLLIRCWSSY